MVHILNRWWWARKWVCEEKNDRTSGRLLVEERSSCRSSWTKELYSARQASISLPLIHPRSKMPSKKRPSRCSGAWLSLPMMIAGQKQLNPCPISKRAATVDSTEFVKSSRNPRASRWNCSFKYEFPVLLRTESCQYMRPSQKFFISIWRNFWAVCHYELFPLLHRRQRRSLLNLLQKAVDDASQLTKLVVSIIARCLRMNEIYGNWNRTQITNIAKTTINRIALWRLEIQDMEPIWNKTRVFPENFKDLIPNHYVPTWIILKMWWWYLQIFRRRWNSLKFMRASWSWYKYPFIPFF